MLLRQAHVCLLVGQQTSNCGTRGTGHPPSHTCCRGNLQTRWPLCVCLRVCLERALHPVPASATPFYDREAPAVPSPAPVDGLSLSALEGDGDEGRDGVMMMMAVWEETVRGKRQTVGRIKWRMVVWGWRGEKKR